MRHCATQSPPGAPLRAHFGGPGRPPGCLRDLLEDHIDAVPAGGTIDWVTYYFRARSLAAALLRAHRRGVTVRLVIDGCPRLTKANDAVRALLGGPDGLGDGFRAIQPTVSFWPARCLSSRVHAKIYCFSHPRPMALIGSFNPSGDAPEDSAVIAEIGDQDRGHNLLVEIAEPALVEGLQRQVRSLHAHADTPFWCCTPQANRVLDADDTTICFYPRIFPHVITRHLRTLGAGDRVRVAMSHLDSICHVLAELQRNRVHVSVIVHDTERRAPSKVIGSLRRGGVKVRRYVNPTGLPMHNKFLLIEGARGRLVLFGSLNLNRRSHYLNHEVLASSTRPQLYDTLYQRWQEIAAEPCLK